MATNNAMENPHQNVERASLTQPAQLDSNVIHDSNQGYFAAKAAQKDTSNLHDMQIDGVDNNKGGKADDLKIASNDLDIKPPQQANPPPDKPTEPEPQTAKPLPDDGGSDNMQHSLPPSGADAPSQNQA